MLVCPNTGSNSTEIGAEPRTESKEYGLLNSAPISYRHIGAGFTGPVTSKVLCKHPASAAQAKRELLPILHLLHTGKFLMFGLSPQHPRAATQQL